MPGELGPLQQGIRIPQGSLVGGDLLLDLLLSVLERTDLIAHLSEFVFERDYGVIGLCLFPADQGKLFLYLCPARVLLDLQCLKAGQPGFDRCTAFHFLQDARPLFLQFLPQALDVA